MRLIKNKELNSYCTECKLEKATNLLKLGKRKDGYYLCEYCKNKLGNFLIKSSEVNK